MTDTLANKPVTLVPYGDRLIVRTIGASGRTKSGIYVPDVAQDAAVFVRAEVMFVGPGRVLQSGERAPMQVKPHDIIVFWRVRAEQVVLPEEDVGREPGVDVMLIAETHIAYRIDGLDRVTGLVDASGRTAVLAS